MTADLDRTLRSGPRAPSSRLLVTASGTMGDHLPMIGIGKALADRGHDVHAALNGAMAPIGRRAGLPVTVIGRPLGPVEARAAASDWDHLDHATQTFSTRAADQIAQDIAELAALARGRDLVITTFHDFVGRLAAEVAGTPLGRIATAVFLLAGKAGADPIPEPPLADGRLNSQMFYESLREKLGLTPEPRPDTSEEKRVLSGSSPFFFAPDSVLFPDVESIGFLLYDDPAFAGFTPDPELQSFVERDPPPLVLTFSSLPLVEPARVLATHVAAATALGRRLLVLSGWAGFERGMLPLEALEGNVLIAAAAPHDWVFARAAAAITHGGLGTIARALRAACPLVIEPYGNDQFFNAKHVVRLGVGIAVHPNRVTGEGLARNLERKVLTERVRARAASVAAELRAERGIEAAVDRIEGWIAAGLCRHSTPS